MSKEASNLKANCLSGAPGFSLSGGLTLWPIRVLYGRSAASGIRASPVVSVEVEGAVSSLSTCFPSSTLPRSWTLDASGCCKDPLGVSRGISCFSGIPLNHWYELCETWGYPPFSGLWQASRFFYFVWMCTRSLVSIGCSFFAPLL